MMSEGGNHLLKQEHRHLTLFSIMMPILIAIVFFISVSFGTKSIPFSVVIDAIFHFDD